MWSVLSDLADRYDAFELWVTQLAFPLQVLLAVLVVLPICWIVAGLMDRAADAAVARLPRRHRPRDRDLAPVHCGATVASDCVGPL